MTEGRWGHREGQRLTKLTRPMWGFRHADIRHRQILQPRQVRLGFKVHWEQTKRSHNSFPRSRGSRIHPQLFRELAGHGQSKPKAPRRSTPVTPESLPRALTTRVSLAVPTEADGSLGRPQTEGRVETCGKHRRAKDNSKVFSFSVDD